MVQAVLQQPAQLTGRMDEPMVPCIQPDQLRVRNAGVHLREQARVQNLEFFQDREQERRQQRPADALNITVDELADSMARQQPVPLPGMVQPQDPTLPIAADLVEDAPMDMGAMEADQNQDDVLMGDGSRAQANDSETRKAE
ncbi:MAG: hypothetical protein GY835_03370 [bacterium]|nr:hypothetical protein [bacterium]